jgi:hypothetical protein
MKSTARAARPGERLGRSPLASARPSAEDVAAGSPQEWAAELLEEWNAEAAALCGCEEPPPALQYRSGRFEVLCRAPDPRGPQGTDYRDVDDDELAVVIARALIARGAPDPSRACAGEVMFALAALTGSGRDFDS